MVQPGSEDPCPFCRKVIAGRGRNPFDVPLADLGDFLVVPALGMFLPGYLLLVSRQHVSSFAHLDRPVLAAVDAWRDTWMSRLADRFGEYFTFEHGMGAASEAGTGACLDHAHLHLVPSVPGAKRIVEELPWEPLAGYRHLSELRGSRYSYFGHAGNHWTVRNVNLPSQWVRRQTAAVHERDDWDWAAYAGYDELAETRRRIAGLGLGEGTPQ